MKRNIEGMEDFNERAILNDRKVFVSMNQLKPLLRHCLACGSPANITRSIDHGAYISLSFKCSKGHENTWTSLEDNIKNYNRNVMLAAAILISGLTYARFQEALSIANIKLFSEQPFYRIQVKQLFPGINNIFNTKSNDILQRLKEDSKDPSLIGDGR